MSNLTDVLTSKINLKRKTAYLLDLIVPADTLTVNRQPPAACRLSVKITGATISGGLVNIAGSTNESFSFSANKTMVGSLDFTSISGITLSGISGGQISISAVNGMGEPLIQELLVEANMPVRFYPMKANKIGMTRMVQGDERIAKYNMMVGPTKDIQENDFVYAVSGMIGMTIGLVSFVCGIFDFDGVTHHLHCEVSDV